MNDSTKKSVLTNSETKTDDQLLTGICAGKKRLKKMLEKEKLEGKADITRKMPNLEPTNLPELNTSLSKDLNGNQNTPIIISDLL